MCMREISTFNSFKGLMKIGDQLINFLETRGQAHQVEGAHPENAAHTHFYAKESRQKPLVTGRKLTPTQYDTNLNAYGS
jgi:hypothetical protein